MPMGPPHYVQLAPLEEELREAMLLMVMVTRTREGKEVV